MTVQLLHRGYIALISVLIISFLLMVFAVLAGENGFRTRMNVTAAEDRLSATHQARSCAFAGLLFLAQDSSYELREFPETVWLTGQEACTVEGALDDKHVSITASGRTSESTTWVQVEGYFASTSALTLSKWLEI